MVGNNNSNFCHSYPTWANACVGNNGNPGYYEYSKGFSLAANLLIEQVTSRKEEANIDDLIYPVCFNMRHSVELRLKGAIQEISFIAELKETKLQFDLSGSHDIGNIWKFLKEHSEKLDGRYKEINGLIDETISDIADVDATGQTFRYPASTESIKHLTDVAVINFFQLKNKFEELEKNLDNLHKLNLWLKQEYSHGTFTSKLSRPTLYKLARDLPLKSEWSETGFSLKKQEIMNKYGISSNDLTKGIKKIQGQYYLSSLIGVNLPLKGITPDQLVFFLDQWVPQNADSLKPSEPNLGLGLDCWERHKFMLDSMKETQITRELVWIEFEDKLTPEYLAGLSAIYYFARDKTFVEIYDTIYSESLSEIWMSFKLGKEYVKEKFMHIFDKTNALSNIVTSLFALGHRNLAETIIGRFGVDSSLNWVERSRSGGAFAFPDYAKY